MLNEDYRGMLHALSDEKVKGLGKKYIHHLDCPLARLLRLHPPAHIHKYALANAPCLIL